MALVAAVAVAMREGFSATRVFYFRDLTIYFYPMQTLALKMLQRGEFPLWNPYSGFGTPFAAMADVLLYYPLTWLTWILPHPIGFNFAVIVHVVLAALGTYWLALHLKMSRAAAFTAAAAYALSGPLLSSASMTNVLVAVSWMPVCLLTIRWTLEHPTVWRMMVLGFTFAMQAIGGEPMFNVATAVLAIPLCGTGFVQLFVTLVPAAAFGIALDAVQILPGVDLLRKSIRHDPVFNYDAATFWSLRPLNLIETVVPDIFYPFSKEAFRVFLYGTGQPYLLSQYLGLLPIGLAAWALSRQEGRTVKALGAMAFGFLLLSFGDQSALYKIAYYLVPLVASSRYPSKLMLMFAFCTALLAGFGIDALRRPAPLRLGWLKWPLAVAAGLVIRLAITAPYDRAWIANSLIDMFPLPTFLAHATKLLALVFVAILVFTLSPKRPQWMIGLAAACIALDLAGTGYWVNPSAPMEIFTQPSPLLKLIGNGDPSFRIDGDDTPPPGAFPIMDGWSPDALAFLDGRLSLQRGDLLTGVRDSRNSSPNMLYTPEFRALRQRIARDLKVHQHATLADYNIRYFITNKRVDNETPSPGLREVGRADTIIRHLMVWEVEGWRPRVELAGGRAKVAGETNSTVTVEVDSPKGGTLLLRENYDSGWRATVDGAPAGILATPDYFREVAVPAGRHTVDFRYRPWTFYAGMSISLMALAAFAVTGVRAVVIPRPMR